MFSLERGPGWGFVVVFIFYKDNKYGQVKHATEAREHTTKQTNNSMSLA